MTAGGRDRIVLGIMGIVAVLLLSMVAVQAMGDDEPAATGTTSTTAGTQPGTADTGSPTTDTAAAPAASTQPPEDAETITIAFAGDSNAEGSLRTRLDRDPNGFVGPFAPTLQGADLAVLNLETAITEGGDPAGKQFTFRAPARVLDALRAGGIDAVSVANNHGMDFGLSGLQDTVAAKRAQADGFVFGIGQDEDEAYAPFLTTVKGQRIGIIGVTQVLDDDLISTWTSGPGKPGLASAKRLDRLLAEVEATRPEVDTLIVFVHWGVEKETCPTADQQALARALGDAGVDIVVGGHQHRVASGGRMGNAFVGYGIGNFLFRANSEDGAQTGVLLLTVTGRRIDSYRWEPGRISDSVPQPLTGAARDQAIAAWHAKRSCTGLTD